MAEAGDGYERIMGLCREELASIGERDTERLCSVLLEREQAIGMYVNDESARQDEAFLGKLEQIREKLDALRRTEPKASDQRMFPGSLSQSTDDALRAAASNTMGFALLMLSPEMLRR